MRRSRTTPAWASATSTELATSSAQTDRYRMPLLRMRGVPPWAKLPDRGPPCRRRRAAVSAGPTHLDEADHPHRRVEVSVAPLGQRRVGAIRELRLAAPRDLFRNDLDNGAGGVLSPRHAS